MVYLPTQTSDLAALVGALSGAHVKRHAGGVTLVGPQLGVVDVPPGARSHHAHLAGTLVGARLEPDSSLARLHGGIMKLLSCFSKY